MIRYVITVYDQIVSPGKCISIKPLLPFQRSIIHEKWKKEGLHNSIALCWKTELHNTSCTGSNMPVMNVVQVPSSSAATARTLPPACPHPIFSMQFLSSWRPADTWGIELVRFICFGTSSFFFISLVKCTVSPGRRNWWHWLVTRHVEFSV